MFLMDGLSMAAFKATLSGACCTSADLAYSLALLILLEPTPCWAFRFSTTCWGLLLRTPSISTPAPGIDTP